MTPKEKAQELFDKFYDKVEDAECNTYEGWMKPDRSLLYSSAKECALIAVNEVLQFMMDEDIKTKTCHYANSHWTPYYYKVKEEIQSL